MELEQHAARFRTERPVYDPGRPARVSVLREAGLGLAAFADTEELALDYVHLFPEFVHDGLGSEGAGLEAHQACAAAAFARFVQFARENFGFQRGRETIGREPAEILS